jgi:hypothetical protein
MGVTMGVLRDFSARPEFEREWLIQNTWCEICRAADLGLTDPVEFSESGRLFLSGNCASCGKSVTSEIQVAAPK